MGALLHFLVVTGLGLGRDLNGGLPLGFHAADAATAFGQALSYQGEHRIFNIGSGTGVSLNEILSIIEAQTGSELRIVYKDRRVFDGPINVLDTSLARDQLKWTPRISLQEGIARTMRWLKTQSV